MGLSLQILDTAGVLLPVNSSPLIITVGYLTPFVCDYGRHCTGLGDRISHSPLAGYVRLCEAGA
jgi:hypothetical protein